MQAQTMDRARTNEIYKEFRSVPKDKFLKASADEIGGFLSNQETAVPGGDAVKLGAFIRLAGRLAHEVEEEEFFDALSKNELPPMKLSAEEMELVRGGVAATITVAVLSAAAGYLTCWALDTWVK